MPTAKIKERQGIVDRHLKNSKAVGLDESAQLQHVYQAALALAATALHIEGYEVDPRIPDKHKKTIASSELTLGLDAATRRRFDAFRRKRNESQYDVADNSSPQEVESARKLVAVLQKAVNERIAQREQREQQRR